jgi:hypothetical protein
MSTCRHGGSQGSAMLYRGLGRYRRCPRRRAARARFCRLLHGNLRTPPLRGRGRGGTHWLPVPEALLPDADVPQAASFDIVVHGRAIDAHDGRKLGLGGRLAGLRFGRSGHLRGTHGGSKRHQTNDGGNGKLANHPCARSNRHTTDLHCSFMLQVPPPRTKRSRARTNRSMRIRFHGVLPGPRLWERADRCAREKFPSDLRPLNRRRLTRRRRRRRVRRGGRGRRRGLVR